MTTNHLHLVEDSPADIELVEEAIESLEYDVEMSVSRDGEEFLEYYEDFTAGENETNRPDLILLDIDLPRKNGFEILEHIKNDGCPGRVPVVVLTMSNAREDLERCKDLGANACVTKPLGFDAFEELLDSTFDFWLNTAKTAVHQ